MNVDSNDPDLIFGGSNEDLIDDDEYLEFQRVPNIDDELEKEDEKTSMVEPE